MRIDGREGEKGGRAGRFGGRKEGRLSGWKGKGVKKGLKLAGDEKGKKSFECTFRSDYVFVNHVFAS